MNVIKKKKLTTIFRWKLPTQCRDRYVKTQYFDGAWFSARNGENGGVIWRRRTIGYAFQLTSMSYIDRLCRCVHRKRIPCNDVNCRCELSVWIVGGNGFYYKKKKKKNSRPNAVFGLESYTTPSAAHEIVKKVEKSMRPSALFGLEKSKKWRPNGALGPYGFSKNECNPVGSVKTYFLIMVNFPKICCFAFKFFLCILFWS